MSAWIVQDIKWHKGHFTHTWKKKYLYSDLMFGHREVVVLNRKNEQSQRMSADEIVPWRQRTGRTHLTAHLGAFTPVCNLLRGLLRSLYASSWVTTLQRTTLAAEVLALHLPVMITIVKPEENPDRLPTETQEIWANAVYPSTHPNWSPDLMGLLEKKAILGKRKSWCMVNTLTARMLGSHRWLMNRPMLP